MLCHALAEINREEEGVCVFWARIRGRASERRGLAREEVLA
jgi:hypothetical protein